MQSPIWPSGPNEPSTNFFEAPKSLCVRKGQFFNRLLDGWHKGVASFSPSDDLIAFGQTDGRILLIDGKNFQQITNFVASNEGLTALAFSPDGSLLATGSGFANTTIKVW